ncbi:MAG: glycoside hydrolase family 16 protein [Acidimicrobiia bacterium]|jgi:beta-glucanase (GH16 family)
MPDLRPRHLIPVVLVTVLAACQPASLPEGGDPDTTSTEAPAATTTTVAPATTTTIPPTTTTTIASPEPMPIEPPEGYELVWNDEFDGDSIDPSNWTYDIGGWGWGNGEAQYYTDRPDNARIQNGLLVIELRQERFEDSYYTSARLKTQGLQAFQYGRIEARIKVPRGVGTWPAFWMLGDSFDRDPNDPLKSNWPDVGEIDIMEHVGREPDLVIGALHGPGYAGAGALVRWNRQDYDIADDFHTFAIDWDVDGIRWLYDGELFWDLGREAVGDREWAFDQPFFIILNVALGGVLGGTIGLDTEFPLYMYVDHVRVYQQVDEPDQ